MDKNYLAKSVCVAKVTYPGFPREHSEEFIDELWIQQFTLRHAEFQDRRDTFPSIMMQIKYLILNIPELVKWLHFKSVSIPLLPYISLIKMSLSVKINKKK